MSTNLSFRAVTSNDDRFWDSIERELGSVLPFYAKNAILYVSLRFHIYLFAVTKFQLKFTESPVAKH